MRLTRWFQSRKPWLKGGLVGVGICVFLFFFYLFVYFPVIDKVYADDIAAHGGTPAWTTTIPMVTGHLLPLLSHFIIEGTALAPTFCKATEQGCSTWVAKEYYDGQDCVPWPEKDEETGTEYAGCCEQLIMAPTAECEGRIEMAGFLVSVLLLMGVYFTLGAIVGWAVGRRKRR
ncbi:hypothetical protein HYU19_05345 [Candidatus Woesearchaeota archaeon]|nr:hypothetical protein [Candidatus Woesearchaeota archaeon]